MNISVAQKSRPRSLDSTPVSRVRRKDNNFQTPRTESLDSILGFSVDELKEKLDNLKFAANSDTIARLKRPLIALATYKLAGFISECGAEGLKLRAGNQTSDGIIIDPIQLESMIYMPKPMLRLNREHDGDLLKVLSFDDENAFIFVDETIGDMVKLKERPLIDSILFRYKKGDYGQERIERLINNTGNYRRYVPIYAQLLLEACMRQNILMLELAGTPKLKEELKLAQQLIKLCAFEMGVTELYANSMS